MVRKFEPFGINQTDGFSVAPAESKSAATGVKRLPRTGGNLPAKPQRSWRWLLIGISICSAIGSMAAAAFLWLMMLPPVPDCEKLSPLAPDRERLYCAQAAAQSGELSELLAGLSLLEQWTPEHPLYNEAQQWLTNWSQSILEIARQRIDQSNLQGAVEIASQIPRSSSLYADAQELIATWQQEWQQGQTLTNDARKALHAQNWDLAAQQINRLRELRFDHWRSNQANDLARQLLVEKRARQTIALAKQTAQGGKPAQLSAAIAQLSRVDSKTFAWADMQPTFNQWSEALLAYGFQQWKGKNLDGAIATARSAALNPNFAQEAEHLQTLSRARKLAIASVTHWEASPEQILGLMEAAAAARQIKPDSRFYGQAQASLQSWELQLQNLKQIQLAQLTASLGHKVALASAIAQAQAVEPDHPRRLQAQTLIAHWNEEIERLEDRPQLVSARKLAEAGTVSGFKAAIAQAQQVEIDRALRGEAQGLIYVWNRQIQVLEDQPTLNQAKILARQGKLGEAIRVAANIQAGRALYPEARAAMRGWQGEIRRIQAAREAAARAEAARIEAARIRREAPQSVSAPEASPQPERRQPPATSSAAPAPVKAPVQSAPPDRAAPPAPPSPPPAIDSSVQQIEKLRLAPAPRPSAPPAPPAAAPAPPAVEAAPPAPEPPPPPPRVQAPPPPAPEPAVQAPEPAAETPISAPAESAAPGTPAQAKESPAAMP